LSRGVLIACSNFDSEAEEQNFIFNKANFTVECGQFGEKLNAVKNKSNWLAGRCLAQKVPFPAILRDFF
jgi:hypothetical protein